MLGLVVSEAVRNIIILLLFLKGIDIITGISRSLLLKEFEARIMGKGLLTFIGELCAIALVIVLGGYFNLGDTLSISTISLFAIKEFTSIIENLKDVGIDLPSEIIHIFKNMIMNPTNNNNNMNDINPEDDDKE